MTPNELRDKYLNFLKERGHAIVPSSPLVPENDPTTLFTGSGMQPMVPYLLGQKHPLGTRIVDSQKCFRSQDIEEVGDNRHTTFFEMLGNWSLGDYFKKEQLEWFFTFLTKEVGLDPNKLFVTVFRGAPEINVPRDTESVEIWKNLFKQVGIDAIDIDESERNGMTYFDESTKVKQDGRIFYYDAKKNWWSRAGVPEKMPVGEPGGPDSEVFYDFGADQKLHENSPFKDEPCHVNCDCGRFLEIGNSVFMEYVKTESGFEKLPKPNVDFGGGFERILAVMNNHQDVFLTDLFQPIIQVVEELSGKKYADADFQHSFRVIADHMRAAVMLAADGVYPSNKEQGYFARRLVRRSIRHAKMLGIDQPFVEKIVNVIAGIYSDPYPEVRNNVILITAQLTEEEGKFNATVSKGLKEFQKSFSKLGDTQLGSVPFGGSIDSNINILSADLAFTLYETFGFPVELSIEEALIRKIKIEDNLEEKFEEAKKKHSDQSRTASAGMFKGGLQDHSEQTTKYHTATHLLHAALRKVLGTHVQQKGSNITGERLRFDFSHPQAMTEDEKKQVETLINEWIDADLPMTKQMMKKEEALKSGAIAFFIEKYPDEVSVYTVGRDPESDWVSKELCGGPHVEHTGQIGHVTLQKEQAASAGVRRVYLM